jgi:hypothetical protein
MTVNQVVPHRKWPSGDARPIAVLKFSPEELSVRYGLDFESGCDDFEEYQYAALANKQIGQIWLWRYQNSPDSGTNIIVDIGVDIALALSLVLETLGITFEELTWIINHNE